MYPTKYTLFPYTTLFRSLKEVERVVKEGSPIVIIDNYGDDEFSSYSPNDISSSVSQWGKRGFNYDVINTEFVFDSRSEEHTSELQSRGHLVCRLLLETTN